VSVRSGLADPVLDAQRIFRGVLDATAHPGRIVFLPPPPEPPAPLVSATAAIALTLLDYETPIWLDQRARTEEVLAYLRFHCGAPLADLPRSAAFALVADAADLPPLDDFDLGSDEYPDRSTTVIVQVSGFRAGIGRRLSGPGIDGERRLEVEGMSDWIWRMLLENHALFPRGVDLLLATDSRVVALPRTTLVEG
jgi:alpha-D-ribose 1-methylphosphonate 5-triphosphate synthase subunit PhnH